ncbi:MAG: thioredoxin family protein [Aquificaceae bacterium]|nr:thioredoxin family protein [Aquificaceae bacterium]
MLLLVSFAFAGPWLSDVDSALKIASQEKRPIAFYFYNKNCVYCAQFEDFVLSQPQAKAALEPFVVVSVALYSDEGARYARKFGVVGTPSVVFYDPSQDKVVAKTFGNRPLGEFLKLITDVCKKPLC